MKPSPPSHLKYEFALTKNKCIHERSNRRTATTRGHPFIGRQYFISKFVLRYSACLPEGRIPAAAQQKVSSVSLLSKDIGGNLMFFNIRKRLRKNHHLQMSRQFRTFTAPYRLPVVYDYVAEAPRRETEGCFLFINEGFEKNNRI